MVSLLALWPYPSSGIILSNSFILSILLILLSVIPSFYLLLVICLLKHEIALIRAHITVLR